MLVRDLQILSCRHSLLNDREVAILRSLQKIVLSDRLRLRRWRTISFCLALLFFLRTLPLALLQRLARFGLATFCG